MSNNINYLHNKFCNIENKINNIKNGFKLKYTIIEYRIKQILICTKILMNINKNNENIEYYKNFIIIQTDIIETIYNNNNIECTNLSNKIKPIINYLCNIKID